jgi:hypothetical protein
VLAPVLVFSKRFCDPHNVARAFMQTGVGRFEATPAPRLPLLMRAEPRCVALNWHGFAVRPGEMSASRVVGGQWRTGWCVS